jgi:hypothetical protein
MRGLCGRNAGVDPRAGAVPVARVGFLAAGFVVFVAFGGGTAGLLSAPTCEKTTVQPRTTKLKEGQNIRETLIISSYSSILFILLNIARV